MWIDRDHAEGARGPEQSNDYSISRIQPFDETENVAIAGAQERRTQEMKF